MLAKYPKIAYLHGRPGPHPMHGKFSMAVGAIFHFVDFRMRWQDTNRSVLFRLTSWIVCSFSFPQKKLYDFFLVDNLHFYPVFMKLFRLIGKKQKIVAHMGSHTLYFIYAHRYSKITEWLHIQGLRRYDALICEGKMAEEIVGILLKKYKKTPKLYTIFNGIPIEHTPTENSYTNNLNGKNILFIGNGPDENRLWYKGLDLMISSFQLAYKNDPDLRFTIVGNWNEDIIEKLLSTCEYETKKSIRFVKASNDLSKFTSETSLYLHCSRGEAFGITILIAIAAGIPALVSEWTGAKEIVEQIDGRFIVPLREELIAEKIGWYFQLSSGEKNKISERGKNIVKNYTESKAIEFYMETFMKIEKDFY